MANNGRNLCAHPALIESPLVRMRRALIFALLLALPVLAGSAAYAVCFWSMLPDTVEYGEWRSGLRTESLVFGLGVLGQKISLGLGAGLLGVALQRVGYVANVEQSAQTIEGIRQMMFWIPLVGGLCSLALIWRYPVTLSLHAKIVEEIAARRPVGAETVIA